MTSTGSLDLSPRRVIYDCNVYLNAARQLGPGFTWASLPSLDSTVTSRRDLGAQYALRIAREGHFAGPFSLELWTSTHITDMVIDKLVTELEWSDSDAAEFGQAMINQAYDTKGVELDVHIARQSPPLDHEDGLVWATAVTAHATYLVTSDGDFDEIAGRNGITVMNPWKWACYVQHWRRQAEKSSF